jgi:ABC-type glycerol-3-phosphate transport system substrate-binding protein
MLQDKIKQLIDRHGLVLMALAALAIAAILVFASMLLYMASTASKLDLSRPGYEKVRETVTTKTDNEPYNTSGALNQTAIDDFRTRFNKQRDEINHLGDFGGDFLSDQALGIE